MGAYSRWALIKFSPFSESEVCLFCNKTINANDKTRRSNKVRFLFLPEENSVLWEVSYENLFTQVGGVGVNAYLSLIEKGRGWDLQFLN